MSFKEVFLIVVLMLYNDITSTFCFAQLITHALSKNLKGNENSHIISSVYEYLSKKLSCKDATGHMYSYDLGI